MHSYITFSGSLARNLSKKKAKYTLKIKESNLILIIDEHIQ